MPKKSDNFTQSDEHNARGIELADRGWLTEAVSEFQKAVQLDPSSTHALNNLGAIYSEKGELTLALKSFLAAIEADSADPDPYHYLGSFLAAHAMELSNQAYRRAIELADEFPEAHLNLAINLADSGKLEEALGQLELAQKQDPADLLIQHELACCLIDLNRLPEAIKQLKQILRAQPECLEAHVDLAIAYTSQGFYQQAQESLQAALELDSNDFSVHYHLAALWSLSHQPDLAFTHLETASNIDHSKLSLWARDDKAFRSLESEDRFKRLFR